MAIIRSGVLGNTRGKVAGVVGSQWKDKNYLREYVKPANPNTAAQQVQRGKMSDAVAFCKSLVGPVFNAYTDKFLKGMSGFNYFIKQNIVEFDGSPVYANIKLTQGKLYALIPSSVTYDAGGGDVEFTYPGSLGNNGLATDAVFAAVFDSSTGFWYFPVAEGARNGGTLSWALPTGLTPANLETYIWTCQYSGTQVSLLSDSTHNQAVAL